MTLPPLSKFRFAAGQPLYLLGDDEGKALLRNSPEFLVKEELPQAAEAAQVFLFARHAEGLERDFKQLHTKLTNNAIFWIAYPKKSGAIKSDLTRDKGWQCVADAGYEGVSNLALDADWSVLRFKKKEAIGTYLRGTPVSERKTEGVDHAARTVTLPPDAVTALNEHTGLHDFFNALSFSHKREWAVALAEAKKPETRARRIQKMVADLLKQREVKGEKASATAKKK